MFQAILDFISELNDNARRDQLAAGFAWGLLLGLVPAGNIIWFALFIVSFFLRHNQVAKLLMLALISAFAGLLAQLMDTVGWQVLHIEALQPFFTTLYNMPLVPLTKFNNTLIAGGLVTGVILWLPVFLLFFFLIPVYREKIAPVIRDSKAVTAIRKIPVVKWIVNYIDPAGME